MTRELAESIIEDAEAGTLRQYGPPAEDGSAVWAVEFESAAQAIHAIAEVAFGFGLALASAVDDEDATEAKAGLDRLLALDVQVRAAPGGPVVFVF